MPTEPTNARKSFGDIAPHLAEITDKVLFGDVWENPGAEPMVANPGERLRESKEQMSGARLNASAIGAGALYPFYQVIQLPSERRTMKPQAVIALTSETPIEFTDAGAFAGFGQFECALKSSFLFIHEAPRASKKQFADRAGVGPWP